MHPANRPHSVDKATSDFLYCLYNLLFTAESLSLRTKQRTFETAADSKNSWRVVSISAAALEQLIKTGTAKGLRRGHVLTRKSRAEYLFNRKSPLKAKALLAYFFEHDTVALVTKAENSRDGTQHWSKLHPVPEELFTAGSFSIYVRKKELEWVQKVGF